MKFSVQAFAKNIALKASRRWCESDEGIWPFLNQIGPEKIKYLIDNDKPFFKVVFSNPNIPDIWRSKIYQAPNYAHYIELMNYGDVLSLLPPWFGELVTAHPKGQQWFEREAQTLKLVFQGV